jgi:hypothetical protein
MPKGIESLLEIGKLIHKNRSASSRRFHNLPGQKRAPFFEAYKEAQTKLSPSGIALQMASSWQVDGTDKLKTF